MKRLIVVAALCCAAPVLAQSAQDYLDEADEEEWYGDDFLQEADANVDSWAERACSDYKSAAESYIKASELLVQAAEYDDGNLAWYQGRIDEIQANAERAVSGAERACNEAYGEGSAYDEDYDDDDSYADDY